MQRERIRIIGGKWRGRLIDVADAPGLRPSGDRVRETLFNWLQHELAGRCCLDLFAGTGALGLEAASRGAKTVHLVEQAPSVCAELTRQCEQLTAGSAESPAITVHCADALELLAHGPQEHGSASGLPMADLVFVAPPFADASQRDVLQLIDRHSWLSRDALVYVEQGKGSLETLLPEGWTIHREKTAGRVTFGLVHPVSAQDTRILDE